MKTKKIILVGILTLIALLLFSSNVQAAYQSKPTTSGTLSYPPTYWILEIRKMEMLGNGMGLNETIGNDGIGTTPSNNIDVHLLKNTEYGAIALLGASDFGKQGTGTARWMNQGTLTGAMSEEASTTGNVSGVYELGYSDVNISTSAYAYEWVAGGPSSFLSKINSRYINRYTGAESSALPGDATVETKYWHGSAYAGWGSNDGAVGFRRGCLGVFSYDCVTESDSRGARAAVVVGNGI